MKMEGPNGFIINAVVMDPQPLVGIGFHNPPLRGVMDPTRGNGWSGRPARPITGPNNGRAAAAERPGAGVDTPCQGMSTDPASTGSAA